MHIQMDPGNGRSKTAVKFICKIRKKREADLRLKELVKAVENILKGMLSTMTSLYIFTCLTFK